jgi:ribose-phosphate pyrophosphokinase
VLFRSHPAGLHCLVVDDIIDTGGTILKAAQSLLDKGALSVSIAATHGVFSMWEEFNAKAVRLGIRGIFTTNSVGTLHSHSDFGINSSVSLDPLIIHHIQKVEKCLQ